MADPEDTELDLDAELFMQMMLRELTGLLDDVVGLEEAEGYIHSVGSAMGRWIDRKYRSGGLVGDLSPEAVAQVFVDLKRRIGGRFYVLNVTDDRITIGNDRCPFGELAHGRDALCMMTSSVFGRIAADRTGYARVSLEKTIARMDGKCVIHVDLLPSAMKSADGRDYFRLPQAAE